MADKPEALRLADALACGMTTLTNVDRAAAELRRQHAEIEQLKAQRDALRALIADDGFAASFQTMAQYRSALLNSVKGESNG